MILEAITCTTDLNVTESAYFIIAELCLKDSGIVHYITNNVPLILMEY